MKLSNLASSLSFAHLLGRDRPVSVTANIRADDDGDGNDDAMKGRKSKARGRAADDKDTDGDGNETDKKGARAVEDEEEEDREEEDEKPDGKKSKKAKSKARAEDSEEDDEEDGDRRESRAMARGAARERARCKAIFASEGAGARPDMAAHFAFNTEMSADDAVSTLNAFAAGAPVAGRQSLSHRMEGVKTPNPGPADVPTPDMSSAKGMAAVMTGVYNAALGRSSGAQ